MAANDTKLYELDPEAWNAYLAQGNARQPRKRVAADVIVLLCVDWIPPHGPWDDTVVFVVDGGALPEDEIEKLTITDDELAGFRFCTRAEAAELLRPYVCQRAQSALDAVETGRARYFHRNASAARPVEDHPSIRSNSALHENDLRPDPRQPPRTVCRLES